STEDPRRTALDSAGTAARPGGNGGLDDRRAGGGATPLPARRGFHSGSPRRPPLLGGGGRLSGARGGRRPSAIREGAGCRGGSDRTRHQGRDSRGSEVSRASRRHGHLDRRGAQLIAALAAGEQEPFRTGRRAGALRDDGGGTLRGPQRLG